MRDKETYAFPLLLMGIFIGVVAVALLLIGTGSTRDVTEYLASTDPDVVATWGSGFVGALIGGCVSWYLTEKSSREAGEKEERIVYEREKTSVLTVALKIRELSNAIYTQRAYLYEAINAAHDEKGIDGAHNRVHAYLLPQISGPRTVPNFEAADFVPFVQRGHAELVNRCTILSKRVMVLEACFETYGDLRRQHDESSAPYQQSTEPGMRAVYEIPPEQRTLYTMRTNEMEDLIRQIRATIEPDFKMAEHLVNELNSFVNSYFPEPGFISLANGEEVGDV